jgi:hypothetical protein
MLYRKTNFRELLYKFATFLQQWSTIGTIRITISCVYLKARGYTIGRSILAFQHQSVIAL